MLFHTCVVFYSSALAKNIILSHINLWVTVTLRKVVTFSKSRYFPKSSYFPNRHNFLKSCYFFIKRHNFLDKTGLNRFLWTDTFLAENGYKRKSIFYFSNTENFPSLHLFFSQIKSKCRSTESVWLVAILKFVEVKEIWGTAISLTGLIRFILGEINP